MTRRAHRFAATTKVFIKNLYCTKNLKPDAARQTEIKRARLPVPRHLLPLLCYLHDYEDVQATQNLLHDPHSKRPPALPSRWRNRRSPKSQKRARSDGSFRYLEAPQRTMPRVLCQLSSPLPSRSSSTTRRHRISISPGTRSLTET